MEIASVNYKRHSPQEHREALHEELTHAGDYNVAAGALRRLHPFLYSFMQDLTTNTYDAEKYHKRKGHDEETTLNALEDRARLQAGRCLRDDSVPIAAPALGT